MTKYIHILALVMILSLLSACGGSGSTTSTGSTASQTISSGDSVNLSWTAPSTRSDGSFLPLTELDGYRIYMGETESSMVPITDISDQNMTQFTVDGLSAGSYYFAVSAFDTDGNESGKSQIILIQLS